MTAEAVASTAGPSEVVFGEVSENWGWLFCLGVLFIVLGVVGLGRLFALSLAGALFFGVLIVVGGVAQFIEALKCKGWKSLVYHVLIGVLYVVGGLFVIWDPLAAKLLLTWILAVGTRMRGGSSRPDGSTVAGYGKLACTTTGRWCFDPFRRTYFGQVATVRSLCHRPVYRNRTDHKRVVLYLHCTSGKESK